MKVVSPALAGPSDFIPHPDACLWIGAYGGADIRMFRGNFSIKDKLNEKIALTNATVTQQSAGWAIRFTRGDAVSATRCWWAWMRRANLELEANDAASQQPRLAAAGSKLTIISTAAASSSHTSICAVSLSRCGPAGRAWAAINRPTSPGRPTAKRTRAAITTGPSSRSLPS